MALTDSRVFVQMLKEEKKPVLCRFFGLLRGSVQEALNEVEKEERAFESVATGEETKERNFELEKELLRHVMDKAKKIHGLFVYGSNKCDWCCVFEMGLVMKCNRHSIACLRVTNIKAHCLRRTNMTCWSTTKTVTTAREAYPLQSAPSSARTARASCRPSRASSAAANPPFPSSPQPSSPCPHQFP